ncbi:hypothetical protein I4U23_015194 [Adineta vaga]|nr:hypothetical protein I4U23_015194 [Adineta vaga]
MKQSREDEILLPAAREFVVKSILPQSGQLCIIQLKEAQPKYPLLESFPTISHVVPTHHTNRTQISIFYEPVSYNPIYKQPTKPLQDSK